ncbi:MAG TPA: carbamate kinase [Solirubrobacteraceae bacterium]|nr:carbamate kinase [Solirubrobacteraceae bacterium]
MRIVIAIGGNAIIAQRELGTWAEQRANAAEIARELVALKHHGHELVLTHGNGPQVGALLLQHLGGVPGVPALPLDALVAMTQGQLGYLLQNAITDADPALRTSTVLTRVVVEADDPAFADPTKPIGRFYRDERAAQLAAAHWGDVTEDAGRGWRTVVASPSPQEILEFEQIRMLAERGVLVIAAGGGGIPVARTDGELAGVPAVIDKDRASAVLALAVEADLLVLLTGVERVALDFGTRWQRDMARLTVSDATRLLSSGEFPPGSMAPKVESAVRFVSAGGQAAIVTSADRLVDAVQGGGGTRIVPNAEGPSATAWANAASVAA